MVRPLGARHPFTWGLSVGLALAVPLVVLAQGWFGSSRAQGEPAPTPKPAPQAVPAAGQRPYAGRGPGTVADVFGINEAVAAPDKLVGQGSLAGPALTRHLEQDVQAVVELGARHIRMNTATYPSLNWQDSQARPLVLERAQRLVALVQAAGVEPLVMVGPWPGNHTANYTEQYVPQDLEAYTRWVTDVVERFDGDGQGDAPGLVRPVRYWEVDNEPDLHNRVPPKNARREVDPSTFETPAEYARVLVETARAIRAADPGALVLNGGIYGTGVQAGRRYLERVLAEPGAAQAVDVLSVHAYFDQEDASGFLTALDNAQALAGGRPIFVTETGAPAARSERPWVNETWQARMVVRVYGEALSRGVERVYWHTLADPPARADVKSGFSTHSLLRATGGEAFQRKPSGDTYARLTASLGAVPLDQVEQVSDGVLRMGDKGLLVFKGSWNGPLEEGASTLDLVTGVRGPAVLPVQAPALVGR